MSQSKALFLQHGDWGPPGLLAEWADARGIAYDVHHAKHGAPLPELNGQLFIASLGSPHNPNDTDVPEVAAELGYLQDAVAQDIPVLGLCFGGQMLSSALGGTVETAPRREIAWHRIDSTDTEQIPEGPWLQWHFDRFTLPPGAQQLASSPAGVQAFAHGRHLGVQFHPESTIDIVMQWAHAEDARLEDLSVADREQLLEDGRDHADAAATAAFDLFDAFWRRAQT
ncbi:type 1 glutamine amidotransferase [Conexibacter woesei]|uniref:type 1 glutamine amidotransferase n=1 Tax=Conexibacter woesei TaxID=191495 RepID=UPI0009DC0D2D|nr:type 1 glutamine amidotransferase [Conexibacter woesei]